MSRWDHPGLPLWLALAAGLLFGVALLLHRANLLPTPGLVPFLALYGLLVGAAGLLVLMTFWRLLNRAFVVPGPAFLAAVLVTAVVAAPILVMLVAGLRYPNLHDISTDPVNPPPFVALAENRGFGSNAVVPFSGDALRQRAAYPGLGPRLFAGHPPALLPSIRAVLAGLPATIVAERQEGASVWYVEFVWKPGFFRFTNDFVMRLTVDGPSTRIDLRAASRYGQHDFGANSRLILAILDSLAEALHPTAGQG